MRFTGIALSAIIACVVIPAVANDDLWDNFVYPPNDSRTKLWWFHGETPSTCEGIDADLTAFKEKGIGGIVFYDQVHGKAEGVPTSMSPEWWQSIKYAAHKAKELGLSFEIAATNGYTAGGTWITPEYGMQQTDYIDTLVSVVEPRIFRIPLPHTNPYFKDIATVIFPDNSDHNTIRVPGTPITLYNNESDTLNYISDTPITIRGISYIVTPRGKGSTGSMNIPVVEPSPKYAGAGYINFPPIGDLQYSNDGITWHQITELPSMENNIGNKSRVRTISFPGVKACMFRLVFHDWIDDDETYKKIEIRDIHLYQRDIIDNFEVKTGLRTEVTYPHMAGESIEAIPLTEITDVTDAMCGDTLSIRLDTGKWRIIRFGHRPTGARTKHGRKKSLGFEADLMSPTAAAIHFNNYTKVIYDSLSTIGCPPSGVAVDSHEAGIANWSPGLEQMFHERNGYDIRRWVPVFANYIVENRDTTEIVLRDFRNTVADAITDGFYATFAELCSEHGMTLTSQAMLNITADNISSRGKADKPQGEFWAYQANGNYDCLDAASAAHLYGRQIASGEAFTDTPYGRDWAELNRLSNLAYCRGINEFVVCASTHQPWLTEKYDDSRSQHPYIYHRLNPDWEYSDSFWMYQARCAHMLRQGDPVVDLCIYLGEDLPAKTMAFKLPVIPEGYNFDVCSLDALTKRMRVKDGNIIVEGGMKYKVLIIQDRINLSHDAALVIDRLERDGAIVIRCDKGEDVGAKLREHHISPDAGLASANKPDDRICFYHRRSTDSDIYFFYNHSQQPYSRLTSLRTDAKEAELWNINNATRQSIEINDQKDIMLTLEPYGSVFVVLPLR